MSTLEYGVIRAVTVAACLGACESSATPDGLPLCDAACAPDQVCTESGCRCSHSVYRYPAECAGRCTDLLTDPTSCGYCGNDCGEGVCSSGACMATPATMAVAPLAPAGLAVAEDDVYFATHGTARSNGKLYRVSKSGGAMVELYGGLAPRPSIAVTAGGVLVNDRAQPLDCSEYRSAGAVVRVPADGGPAELVRAGTRCASWLLADEDGLAWIEVARQGDFLSGGGPWIASLPAGAPPEAPAERVHGPLEYLGLLQRVAGRFYFREGLGATTRVKELEHESGSVATLASDPRIEAFAIQGGWLYLAYDGSYVGAELVRQPLAGGERENLSEVDARVVTLAVDDAFVYWVDEDGEAGAYSLGDREKRALTLGKHLPFRAIGQDASTLYILAEDASGSTVRTELLRLTKPPVTPPPHLNDYWSSCPQGWEECGPVGSELCTDLANDSDHCGGCGAECAGPETCVQGRCECAATSLVCGGLCVDPATDAENCGACGRSCEGGACAGGECGRRLVAESLNAKTLAQDADRLYFTRGGGLYAGTVECVAKQDGATQVLAAGIRDVTSITVDDTRVYYIDHPFVENVGAIYSVPKDASAPPTLLYDDRHRPRQLRIADGTLYWVEAPAETAQIPLQLVSAAADGSGAHVVTVTYDVLPDAFDFGSIDVLVRDTSLYWLLGDPGASRSVVFRVPIAGTDPPEVAHDMPLEAVAIAIAGETLVFAVGDPEGAIVTAPLAGGDVVTRVSHQVGPHALAAIGDRVYWISGDDSEWGGGLVQSIVPGEIIPRVVDSDRDLQTSVLLVDEQRIYVSDLGQVYAIIR